ncbi:MAG: cytochrome b/b6 domain-containing protein [Alphaproteobacteria bacterium]
MTAETADAAPPPRKVMVKRHGLLVRLNHWINVIALTLLLMSGLQIFNGHSHLYWGKASDFGHGWLSMDSEYKGKDLLGYVTVLGHKFDTTGFLGASKFEGKMQDYGFPPWLVLPHAYNLTVARRWHFFWAWIFVTNGLIYLITGLIGRRLPREVIPTGRDLKTALKDPHLRLKFSKGPEAAHYHQMQKIAYAGVIFVLLPVVALTGMTMSPGLNAAFPFLLQIFGGRQSARSIHFICANLIVAFVLVHLLAVLLSGPINQVRAMITGRLAIIPDAGEARP